MKHNIKIDNQLKSSPGLISSRKLAASPYNYFTLTAWESHEYMLSFMRSGAHGQAMREIAKMADMAKSFGYESTYIPNWKEAREKVKEGKHYAYV